MTGATPVTDSTTDATTDDGKATFEVVPTLAGYLELAERVNHLEANQPATGSSDDVVAPVSEDELDAIHSRIDRHRAEIEEIKKRYNQLVRYLDASLAPAQPVSSQDTIQPQTRRDLIQ
jgi:hypothetical protein